MDKAQISETTPRFLGMYAGVESGPGVQKPVEGADLVLNLGGVAFADFNTTVWTLDLDPARMITVWPDYVTVGDTTFGSVYLADVLDRLTEAVPKTATPRVPAAATTSSVPGAAADRVSSATLYPRLAKFLRADDIVIAETGLCMDHPRRVRRHHGRPVPPYRPGDRGRLPSAHGQ
jgi:indolepyruvate decarboxylase